MCPVSGITRALLALAILVGASACSSSGDLTQPRNPRGGPQPSQPGLNGLTGFAILADNFSNYANTAALRTNMAPDIGGTGSRDALYADGSNGDLLEIDTSVLYMGHHTLKYNQPGGSVRTPELLIWLPRDQLLSKAWIRIKVRFSPNYTTLGTTPGVANAYKLLGWSWEGADGRGTLEFTNLDEYTFNWDVNKNGNPVSSVVFINGPFVTTEWSDGGWYQYIVFYEQTSATTIRQRWWMSRDGETPLLRADIMGQMLSGTVPRVNRILLGLNFNSQRRDSGGQALWYGQWEVIDGTRYPNPFKLIGV